MVIAVMVEIVPLDFCCFSYYFGSAIGDRRSDDIRKEKNRLTGND